MEKGNFVYSGWRANGFVALLYTRIFKSLIALASVAEAFVSGEITSLAETLKDSRNPSSDHGCDKPVSRY